MDKNEKALTVTSDDDFLPVGAMTFDGPTGFEGVTSECITIPFLKVAQAGTDEAKRGDPKQIPGLEVGQFFCPTTRKVYGDGISIVILKFYRQYIVYESKESDAKFIGVKSPEEFTRDILPGCIRERSFHLDKDGKRYVDTRNFVVLVHGHYDDGPMLLSLSSTGIKPSQKLLTMATNVRADDGRLAPIWTSGWELVTGYQSNEKGSYYQIASVSRRGWVPESRKKLIVSAFLDANALTPEDLSATMQKASGEDKYADGEHTFENAKEVDQAAMVSKAFSGKEKAGLPVNDDGNQSSKK